MRYAYSMGEGPDFEGSYETIDEKAKLGGGVMTESYENLANAIVLQAVKDYRDALKRLKKKPGNQAAMSDAMECERFFRSQWYGCLTSVDGDYLINRLREEVKAK